MFSNFPRTKPSTNQPCGCGADITTFEGKAETLQADVDEAAKLQERAEKLLAEKNSELAKAKKKVSKVSFSSSAR